jgi:hypothetical protein
MEDEITTIFGTSSGLGRVTLKNRQALLTDMHLDILHIAIGRDVSVNKIFLVRILLADTLC